MGYKLAGYNVLGGVEIDPKMMEIYRRNHKPRLSFLMGVQKFKNLPTLPDELFDLDILDGSPPCSSFSMAGSREKAWGKSKKFREGQAEQVLDDLYFDFIAIAKRLQPRVAIAENVRGLIAGNARGYVKQIFAAFVDAGYVAQLFLLNASRMGVPQARERTFFIAQRAPGTSLQLAFNEPQVTLREAFAGTTDAGAKNLSRRAAEKWAGVGHGGSFCILDRRLHPDQPAWTQTATPHWGAPRLLSPSEAIRVQTFPDDFDFVGQMPQYVCGMSVPPYMMERVAVAVADQLLLLRQAQ